MLCSFLLHVNPSKGAVNFWQTTLHENYVSVFSFTNDGVTQTTAVNYPIDPFTYSPESKNSQCSSVEVVSAHRQSLIPFALLSSNDGLGYNFLGLDGNSFIASSTPLISCGSSPFANLAGSSQISISGLIP